jgi:hypothetical protein
VLFVEFQSMSIFSPHKKSRMSEENTPDQTAMDIKALNLFSRQNAALGMNEYLALYFSNIAALFLFYFLH